MATYLTITVLMGLIVSATLGEPPRRNKDILVAVKEMRAANYFTFVMLINMVQNEIPSNTTFLMPSDRLLSGVLVPQEKVLEFLSRHSIPSPMFFDNLRCLPTGTVIPTHEPDFNLRIANKGRKRFYVNDIQIIKPDICVAGSSIRCHGIDGVLIMIAPESNETAPKCSHVSPSTGQPYPAPSYTSPTSSRDPGKTVSSPPPMSDPANTGYNTLAPPPEDFNARSHKSRSSSLLSRGLLSIITSSMMLCLMNLQNLAEF